nr:hypothetical protein StreXyl84_78750 [Streptomyces sp. Xyl84]
MPPRLLGNDGVGRGLGQPEVQIFMRADSDAVNALNGGTSRTGTKAITIAAGRITTECTEAYPK